jgi:lactate dehydrogenase-like 2-hydroxyacid dehydrogenase
MIVIMPDAHTAGVADIEQAVFGDRAEIHAYKAASLDEIPAEDWEAAEALMIWGRLRCDKAMLDRAPNVRMIIRMGVGFDALDIEEAGRRGIPACNVPDYGTTDVADHAIGLMLSLTRGIVQMHNKIVADPVGNWKTIDIPIMRRVRGTTFGIVGCGRIGTAAGLRAKALGMKVIFYDPYVLDGKDQSVGFERRESLEEMLSEADVVSIHTPLTAETNGMINGQVLSSMKETGILITTARGKVCDLDAVTEALKNNRIAAAGLDVLPNEPPDPNHPLFTALKAGEDWTVGRVIVTSHVAWFSPDGAHDAREKGAKTVINYLADGVLRNCVNQQFLVAKD